MHDKPEDDFKKPIPSFIISAASSTKDVLVAVVEQYKKDHRVEIKLNSGPSSSLANQIIAGAPADIFLSANAQWPEEISKAGLMVSSKRLLTNSLVLVVPQNNPAYVQSLHDLMRAEVKKIALAGENVPAGIYANQSLQSLSLLNDLESQQKIVRGQDVRTALSYVERGEAEAGIVYSTDVAVAEGVKQVYEFDAKSHDEILYVLVRVKSDVPNPEADAFFDYLLTEKANEIYQHYRFHRLTVDNKDRAANEVK